MMSLKRFKNLTKEEQDSEIEHLSKVLEITYNSFEETNLLLLRGQMWKLEKYLILYYYLQK